MTIDICYHIRPQTLRVDASVSNAIIRRNSGFENGLENVTRRFDISRKQLIETSLIYAL